MGSLVYAVYITRRLRKGWVRADWWGVCRGEGRGWDTRGWDTPYSPPRGTREEEDSNSVSKVIEDVPSGDVERHSE